jgi:hypothetical protein
MTDTEQFATRLRRFSRRRRGLLNAALSYRLGFRALTVGVLVLVVLGGLSPWALFNLALFAGLALFLLGLGTVLLRQWTRFRSPLEEAFHLEHLAGNLNSRVISAWDFLETDTRTPLTRRVIETARHDLEAGHEARLDSGPRNQSRLRFLAALVMFVCVGLTPLFDLGRVGENFRRSWLLLREFFFPVAYVLTPDAGTHIYRLGEKVQVRLKLPERQYPQVRLVKSQGDQVQPQELTLGADATASTEVTSDVETEYRLHFEFGDRRSDELHLVFTTPPALVNMQTELIYPAYTRLLPRSLDGIQQRLLGLPGTRMTLGFTFSKELEEASFTWEGEDAPRLPLEVVGRFATVSLLHREARRARLQVRDVHGFELEAPLLIDFEVQTDEKPVVLLPRHLKDDMPVLEEGAKLFGFGVQASDDFGITRVVLKWQKTTVDNTTTVLDRGEVERLISPVQPKVLVNFDKVFAGLGPKPGDKVSFTVEAHDNLSPGKPQVTVSRRCSLFVFQEALGGLSIKELGLGSGMEPGQERIPKSTRATTVKAPEGLRTREAVWNQFEADVNSGTRPPTLHGEHGPATRDYFRLLSTLKPPEEPAPGKGPKVPPGKP